MKYIKVFEDMTVDELPFPKIVLKKLKKDILDIKQMLVDIYSISDDSKIMGVYKNTGRPGFLMTVKFKSNLSPKNDAYEGEPVNDRVANMFEEIITLRNRLLEIGYRLKIKITDWDIKLYIELI